MLAYYGNNARARLLAAPRERPLPRDPYLLMQLAIQLGQARPPELARTSRRWRRCRRVRILLPLISCRWHACCMSNTANDCVSRRNRAMRNVVRISCRKSSMHFRRSSAACHPQYAAGAEGAQENPR